MSVKPGLLPISPKDARSAISAYKMLERDVTRLKKDLSSKKVCDVQAAHSAIQLKQRQIATLREWMRQYHIDLSKFGKLEAERRRQAAKRQKAIFETQRRETVPKKGSPEQKAAFHREIIEATPEPILPPVITLPPLELPPRIKPPMVPPAHPPMTLLRMLEESTEVEDIQYIKPALLPGRPVWLVTQSTAQTMRHLAIIEQMLERLYKSRRDFNDRAVVFSHLNMLYQVNKTPLGQRLSPPLKPAPPPARPPVPHTPPLPARPPVPHTPPLPARPQPIPPRMISLKREGPSQADVDHLRINQERQQKELDNLRARQEAAIISRERGEQAIIEQTAAASAKAEEVARRQKALRVEQIRIVEAEAKKSATIAKEKLQVEKKRANEQRMIVANERRRRESERKENALKQKEKREAEKGMRVATLRRQESQVSKASQEVMLRKELETVTKNLNRFSKEINQLETVILPQLNQEMEHSKMRHPEVFQDMSEHNFELRRHIKSLKDRAIPLERTKNRINTTLQTLNLGSIDNTAGLRAWHKNLFTKKSVRTIPPTLITDLNTTYQTWKVPQHIQDEVSNVIAAYKQGKYSDNEIEEVITGIVTPYIEEKVRSNQQARALAGTPQHIKYGKVNVASNNYQRLRQLQQGEHIERAVSATNTKVADEKAQLAGLFPKLRDSVTRMVGY